MFDVITVGSAILDVFANTDSDLIKIITPTGHKDLIAYPSGSKILIKELDFSVGGGGTNTAVSFSRLGLRTAYIGKLGKDQNANEILNCLKENNVLFLGKQGGQTGYSVILDSIEHDRTILTFKGANNNLKIEDVDFTKLNTKWFYFSSMLEESWETALKIADYAFENKKFIAFNPSIYHARMGLTAIKPLLVKTNVLILNKEEAQTLLNESTASTSSLAEKLIVEGPKIVIITDGPRGAFCRTLRKEYTILPTPSIPVIETTGAGDAFASAFVTGLIHDMDVKEALKLGMIQAESVIQMHGAKNTLLTLDTAIMYLNERQYTINSKDVVSYKPTHLSLPEFNEEEHSDEILFDNSVGLIVCDINQAFMIGNDRINDLAILGKRIAYMNSSDYNSYVNIHKNDFANWIEHVFKIKTLSKNLRMAKNRHATCYYISSYLSKVKKK